jgi:hypothetical protein
MRAPPGPRGRAARLLASTPEIAARHWGGHRLERGTPGDQPSPDWIATVRTLVEAGASTQGITLSPDDLKPPSAEVAQLLRGYGIGARAAGGGHRGGRAP